jgi:hypothetical protein
MTSRYRWVVSAVNDVQLAVESLSISGTAALIKIWSRVFLGRQALTVNLQFDI